MRPKRWNLIKSSGIGAAIGAAYALGIGLQESLPALNLLGLADVLGQLIGGGIVGGLLVGIVVGLRNLILRAE